MDLQPSMQAFMAKMHTIQFMVLLSLTTQFLLLNKGLTCNSYNSGYNTNYNQGQNHNLRGGARLGTQDRRQLYCDHCKMTGHTIQKCYKIHGYPPGHKFYKGRKVLAAAAQTDSVGFGISSAQDKVTQVPTRDLSQAAAPSLTNAQYNQLMLLLNQQNVNQDRSNSEDMNAASFLVGRRFCFFTSLDNSTWVIDSGASDHITPNLSLLQDV